jgi:hypothetical protein
MEEKDLNQSTELTEATRGEAATGGGSSAGAAAATARALSPDEEKPTMNLFRIINEKIGDRVTPLTLSYREAEVTVLSLHWNGFHCRDEQGAAIVVPFEWQYLKEIVGELD